MLKVLGAVFCVETCALREKRCREQTVIFSRLCLAYHSPLSPETVPTKVSSRPWPVLHWVFEAKKRFGLSVLNYMVTSTQVDLLVKATGSDFIAQSMQLIAGRTAQEYNERKNRHGAFWEDRYHATAIEADEHLHRCLVYIEANMVRAGAVSHFGDLEQSGYGGIQNPSGYAWFDLSEKKLVDDASTSLIVVLRKCSVR